MMANMHGENAVGATVEWYTPPELFEALGMEFDLDPASPGADAVPWVPARRHYTARENGLLQPWDGMVWLNPPYGPPAPLFLHRLAEHGRGMALVFPRTETRWWQATAPRATVICFLRHRLAFIRADGRRERPGRTGVGSALLAFGDEAADALRRADLGWLATSV